MTNNLVTYPTANLAKEKGFDIITKKYYRPTNPLATKNDFKLSIENNYLNENYNFRSYGWLCLAPSQIILHDWLIDKYHIEVCVIPISHKTYQCNVINHYKKDGKYIYKKLDSKTLKGTWINRSTAFESGLQEALKSI